MFSHRNLIRAGLLLGLVLAFSGLAFAQQPQALQDNGQPQEGPRQRGRHDGMRKRGMGGILRLASRLNLTDAQQQQVRAIAERLEASTKAQRDEIRRLYSGTDGEPSADVVSRKRSLRAEIGETMRAGHQEMLNVLTEEQRTQLQQLVRERKDRHRERRGRRMNQTNNDDDQ